jgi:hypothetical protein
MLIVGLQSSAIGFAANLNPCSGMTSAAGVPCPMHAAMFHSHHGDRSSHHGTRSVPASCIAHCAGMAALPPSMLILSLRAERVTLDSRVVVSLPGGRIGPAFRPPIA